MRDRRGSGASGWRPAAAARRSSAASGRMTAPSCAFDTPSSRSTIGPPLRSVIAAQPDRHAARAEASRQSGVAQLVAPEPSVVDRARPTRRAGFRQAPRRAGHRRLSGQPGMPGASASGRQQLRMPSPTGPVASAVRAPCITPRHGPSGRRAAPHPHHRSRPRRPTRPLGPAAFAQEERSGREGAPTELRDPDPRHSCLQEERGLDALTPAWRWARLPVVSWDRGVTERAGQQARTSGCLPKSCGPCPDIDLGVQ